MLLKSPTKITSQYHQVKIGGDTAAMMGIAKVLFDLDKTSGHGPVVDRNFIREHTNGFDEFETSAKATEWDQIERQSGLTRGALEAAAAVYAHAKSVMFVYGMGLTQHKKGVETVQTLVNLALLRGNIGRPGAGICPVRGHSNVQGQRTVGITEKPEQVPAEKLKRLFGIDTPQKKGVNTVEACEKIIDGSVRAVVLLGGNLVRSVPEHRLIDPAWRKLRLTVQILTKLNRTALVHGEISYILPCLGRIEIDHQASGPQAVSMEDSTGCMHGSRGQVKPASPHLLSEAKIVAEFAKATVPTGSTIPWDDWVADYSKVRDAIAQTYPDIFHDFNAPLGARRLSPTDRRPQARVENQVRQGQLYYAYLALNGHRHTARAARRVAAHDVTQQRAIQYDGVQLRRSISWHLRLSPRRSDAPERYRPVEFNGGPNSRLDDCRG